MIYELQNMLLSDMPLFISADGYRRLMVQAFPTAAVPVSFFGQSKDYEQQSAEAFQKIVKALSLKTGALGRQDGEAPQLTMDYSSPDVADGAIAYHRVWGVITADSRWFFSSKRMEQQLLDAEQNPRIGSHLVHVNSPGGEAWYMDRLSQTLDQLRKPLLVLYETACSAAYYIACHGRKVYATTQFDFVGCIGTMTSFYDFSDYYKQLGINLVEAKATRSDLKNKMFDDLADGHPEQYINEVLNPMNDRFLATVCRKRKQLAELPADAPVLRGETFYTEPAKAIGLCDGVATLEQVVTECHVLGRKWLAAERGRQQLYGAL